MKKNNINIRAHPKITTSLSLYIIHLSFIEKALQKYPESGRVELRSHGAAHFEEVSKHLRSV